MHYEVKKQKLSNREIIAYREAGNADSVLLLLHGNQSSSLFFEQLMNDFEEITHIYALDMAGFGDSTYINPHEHMNDWAEDIFLFMEEKEIEKAIVLGWSAGGGVAMELAINHPKKVLHSVLVASVGVKGYLLPKVNELMIPIKDKFITMREEIQNDRFSVIPALNALRTGNTDFFKAVWNKFIFNFYQPEKNSYSDYMREILKERCLVDINYALCNFNITSEQSAVMGDGSIKKINSPITWIHGKNDLVVPYATAEDSIKYFKGRAELIPLENAGHACFMEKPEIFNKILSDIIYQYLPE